MFHNFPRGGGEADQSIVTQVLLLAVGPTCPYYNAKLMASSAVGEKERDFLGVLLIICVVI